MLTVGGGILLGHKEIHRNVDFLNDELKVRKLIILYIWFFVLWLIKLARIIMTHTSFVWTGGICVNLYELGQTSVKNNS